MIWGALLTIEGRRGKRGSHLSGGLWRDEGDKVRRNRVRVGENDFVFLSQVPQAPLTLTSRLLKA